MMIHDTSLDQLSPRPANSAPRVALYSHDTLGFGHLRRNLLLARALKSLPCPPDVLLIAGMHEAGAFDIPDGVDLITLPAYAKQSDGSYRSRKLSIDLRHLADMRARMIHAAVKGFRPDLIIVDNVPRGAQGELEPTLSWLARKTDARVVLGLRDVIDTRDKVRRQWLRQCNFEAISAYYSDIWIYGDPNFYNLIDEYQLGDLISAKARFTGYLQRDIAPVAAQAEASQRQVIGDDDRPYVLCTVGGGRDGVPLCRAFLQARLPDGHRGILITGTQLDAQSRADIAQLAKSHPEVSVVDFLSEPMGLMQNAARIIAMGGYNTICEVLSLRRPALIVPRVAPRREQILRAEPLAARGLIDMIAPDDLTPAALTRWMARETAAGAVAGRLDLDGLSRFKDFATQALTPAKAQSGPLAA
ncbi:glycosyltransferase [uncultured Roseobacter sp.]|uniref:glycosyltransferase family protein n=1 Tax=uncultured Roseobacter sp. TaxID=114847 RepID=UPI00261B5896|nr:glycosyltransferase [uncultured Roseobacter sp.]